jgi:hypothetical protein
MRICLSLRYGSFSVAILSGIILTKVSGWELRREVISVAKRVHGVWFQDGEIFLIASSSELVPSVIKYDNHELRWGRIRPRVYYCHGDQSHYLPSSDYENSLS